MRKRNDLTTATTETRLLDVQQLQAYLSLGRNNAVQFAKEHGAARQIGKRLLFDRKILDVVLDGMDE